MLTALGIGVALATASADARGLVDQIRKDHGLPRVRPNSALQSAADKHVSYMLANNTVGHQQRPGDPGFIGSTPGERARRFGYVGANSEAVAWGDFGLQQSLQGLFDAPYHRVMFLQPSAPDFGGAFSSGALCLKFGGQPGDGSVVSPPNGARNVPTSWDGIESPSPLRSTNWDGPVGYPVVLALFGKERTGFRFVSARLQGSEGEVKGLVLHPVVDPHAENAVIFVPRLPLRRAANYTATIVYVSNGSEKTVRTTFSTGR